MTPFLENLLLFTSMLQQVGIPVSLAQKMELAQALELVDVGQREQVYYAARGLLLNRRENLRLFDAVFARFWRVPGVNGRSTPQPTPLAPRHERPKPFTIVNYMAYKARPGDREIEISDKSHTFSNVEIIQRKEFSQMTAEELETIKRLIQEMQWQVSLRQTRRRVADKRGDTLHLRRMLRSASKHNGVPLGLAWQRRKVKERPFVLIADISGSMEKQARLLLQFFYSLSHSFKAVETFVFGTRLTRITGALKLKNIDRAVDEAAREVVDWAGGTRIGESLHAFNQQWSRRVLRRGAVVLIVSDGWERGDVAQLKKEMAYLQRRCHRLIWLNPLLGKVDYRPLVEGMAAALPHIDDFLPIHNLQSLQQLAQHLGKLGK